MIPTSKMPSYTAHVQQDKPILLYFKGECVASFEETDTDGEYYSEFDGLGFFWDKEHSWRVQDLQDFRWLTTEHVTISKITLHDTCFAVKK